MSKLVLFDGHAILHRAYHAYPPLTTSKGELINAVYGFTSILLSSLREIAPEYVAVTFDKKAPTFRHKEFKDYKAHRPEVDKELVDQIPRVYEVVKALNIPIFAKSGFEADDVIGTLANQASIPNIKYQISNIKDTKQKSKIKKTNKLKNLEPSQLEIIIVTGDNDVLQLVNNKVKVFMPGRGKRPSQTYGRKEFIKKFRFEPRQLVDYKALSGDVSDGIPGVKGIGPKTATDLIIKFGSVEGIYKNLDSQSIKGNVRDKLADGIKLAKLSKKLATIVCDVPIKFEIKKCKLADYDKEKVVKLFEELEFRSLIRRLPGIRGTLDGKAATLKFRTPVVTGDTEGTEKKDKQMELF